MQTIAPGMSAFKDVISLDPGCFLRIRKRGGKLDITQHRYWDFEFPDEEAHQQPHDEQEHVEKIRAELIDAIVKRLEADVPVGAYLSGGIDSCCILGLASGAMQSPVKASIFLMTSSAAEDGGESRSGINIAFVELV